MVEFGTAAKGLLSTWRVGRTVAQLLPAYLGRDPHVLADLMREGDLAWVTEFCERLRGEQAVLEDRFREVHPLVTSLRWEAARDATDDRRRMLACIAAHLLNSGETVENKARVERAIRGLDAADAALLALLFTLPSGPAFSVWERDARRSNLNACVDIDYRPLAGAGGAGKPTLVVSATGDLVLDALRDFHFEQLLAGFEQVVTDVRLDEWIQQSPPALPFWVSRRATHPIRVLELFAGPSICGELFAWDVDRKAYVLVNVAKHHWLQSNEWTVLKPKGSACFMRQDDTRDGRPLIVCDPMAEPTRAELEFISLRHA